MHTTLKELIYGHAGGIRNGHQLKAVIPGGSSVPILLPDQLDIPASFDGVAKAGSMLGSAGIIVMDETTCMVWTAMNLMHFYKHESCGQCTPCREGCGWIVRILDKVVAGTASIAELDRLSEVASDITGNTICAFGDGAAQPALAFVRKFRKQLEDYVHTGGKSQTGRLTT